MRILYDSKNKKYKTKFGTLRQGEGCGINIYIPSSCKTTDVKLIFNNEDGSFCCAYSMKKSGEQDLYEIFSCEIAFAQTGLFFYYFIIKTENEEFRLYKQGYDMTNMEEGDFWQLSCIPSDFSVPESFIGNVMYQIFPDRFNIGGKCNTDGKLMPFSIHGDVAEIPEYMPDEKGIVQNNDFFGGNLKGITAKLDYLKTLHVGVLYLNPIFKAYSNHRYDTADYMKIDEMLGTEEDFVELCKKAKEYGIKIILDGVFSHTGSNSVYFDSENIFGNGAYSNENSPYREWFDFVRYPDEYTSWWGIKTLPCVNENNDLFRDYIIRNEDSVIAHWLNLGADGFRLDVADELPDSFIAELRARMKAIKKDSLLIGEVWEDASNKTSYGSRRKYFTDGELDSVMNYPFRNAIIDLLSGNDDGQNFRNTVMTIAENYPSCVLNTLMNILSTHDTVRIITALGIDSVPSQKSERAVYKLSEDARKKAVEKLMCAIAFQFVLPGMPCIYYGDEIGTEGFEDPFCRTFFEWSKTDENFLLDFYREISAVKAGSEVLKYGDVNVLYVKSGVVSVIRNYNGTRFVLTANLSDEVYAEEIPKKILLINQAKLDEEKIYVEKYGFFCSID
ncbi:MAG: glycoside hydrolase family 13 protein [Clostridia bacterium]|nr:glycoside hydrolase family 13 protein [Clostridia bacterium]